ncbi:MAG: class I SAM-dependent rRNA methyltransferase [Candidatus Atribacteria bacterium]|nr:class I SAM-dependent rRNA methyltransferase [Candidatus Atribacteria bacterium]
MERVIISRRAEERILRGHPWAYQGEVSGGEKIPPGTVVAIGNRKGRVLGKGHYNPRSKIALRVLTRDPEEAIDISFFRRRIGRALGYRERYVFRPDTDCYRLVFAEADFLPGLIVDRFGLYLVVQILTAGMENHREVIVDVLQELLKPQGIYERSDVSVRELEGLPLRQGFIGPPFEPLVTVRENGLLLQVDLASGQKTGYFLDQRDNRVFLRHFVRDRRVLDCFSYIGGFSLHAAFFGAREVIGVDLSEEAIRCAVRNAQLNGLEKVVHFEVANAFDFLREMDRTGERFEVVILDPPAFVKSKQALSGALRGYKEINLRAMKIIAPGGILMTSSCSHHLSLELFRAVLEEASLDVKRRIRILAERGQALDHPVLLGYEESQYLKCLVVEVV